MPRRPPLVGSNELSQLHQQNQNEQDRGENGSDDTLKDGDGATLAAKSIEKNIHGVTAQIRERNEEHVPDDLPHLRPG